MQVSVETLNDLERRVTVQIPAETFTKEMQDRMRSLSKTVRLDGFRKGKIPIKVIDRLYGDQVRYEVISKLVENSLQEALVQEKLRPLDGPKIEPQPFEEGRDFAYSATFEILPEFEPTGFEEIHVERPVAEVTEQDVDNMIETLRQQRAIWSVVERPAREGDRVRVDFEGKIDDRDFAGGKGENTNLVLGKSALLKDFEERLIGLSAGAEIVFDLTFPADYYAVDVAGKTARFQVKLHAVEESHLPEVDETFIAGFEIGDGGITALRQALRENMERELHNGIKARVKRQVMQGLLEANPFPLPQALIAVEIENLARQMSFPPEANDEKSQQLKTQWFEPEARRRVALGLLVSRLAVTQQIEVDSQRVRGHLESLAASYQDPAEVLRWYEKTPRALDSVRALVLEEQIVEWVLERARVSASPSTFAEIMNSVQPPTGSVRQESSA
jgi:trigger factor